MLLFLDIYGPHSGSSRRVVLYTKSVQGHSLFPSISHAHSYAWMELGFRPL
uniref:Uncharacterized protein n=1 Tax=Populus trichocarpa TaxID=3694 RepID=A9PI79_POPTR|nr:unknown [Populus trichocarpa]